MYSFTKHFWRLDPKTGRSVKGTCVGDIIHYQQAQLNGVYTDEKLVELSSVI